MPAGLGVYGIPPVKKQGVLKDGIVKQAQGDAWHGRQARMAVVSSGEILQVIDSTLCDFSHTDVGTDITIEQIEQLGIPLVIANKCPASAPPYRYPGDHRGRAAPGGHRVCDQ